MNHEALTVAILSSMSVSELQCAASGAEQILNALRNELQAREFNKQQTSLFEENPFREWWLK